MDPDLILSIIIALLFFSFFTGIEVAFQSANRLQIELEEKHGTSSGRILSYFIRKPLSFYGTIFCGKMVSLVLVVVFITQSLAILLSNTLGSKILALAIIIGLSTVIILLITELVSKNIFLINPNRILSLSAIAFFIFYILFFPFVFIMLSVSKFFFPRLRKKELVEEHVFSQTNLSHFVKSLRNDKDEEDTTALETRIFHNAMEFKSVRVRECMVPRTEIIAIAMEEGIEKLKEAFVESGHSKIVVYKESIDDVIGFCHSSALFKKPENIEEILTPIITVPETTLANELMIKFINERKSLAVVLDEFGGTSGLVSMEDVIEEIFGEIEDEHDEDHLLEQKIDEKTYLLSARLEIDYLNEAYLWSLPEGDYETLSGLLLASTENIPQPGEKVTIPPYSFIVQSTLDNRIDVVLMVIEG